MKSPRTGITPPMAAPLRGRDVLDVPGPERLVDDFLTELTAEHEKPGV